MECIANGGRYDVSIVAKGSRVCEVAFLLRCLQLAYGSRRVSPCHHCLYFHCLAASRLPGRGPTDASTSGRKNRTGIAIYTSFWTQHNGGSLESRHLELHLHCHPIGADRSIDCKVYMNNIMTKGLLLITTSWKYLEKICNFGRYFVMTRW